MEPTRAELIEATVRITAAFLSRNMVSPDQLPAIIRDIHGGLSGMDQTPIEPDAPSPAVTVRRSVRKDAVVCMECGKEMKMLRRHLNVDHGLSVREYKAKWGLPADHPVVAPDYSQERSDWAKRSGLGRKVATKSGAKKA